MTVVRTLSDRFRLHRTDRIRVDGTEVVALAEVRTEHPTSIEIVFEKARPDPVQSLTIESSAAPLLVRRTMPELTDESDVTSSELTVDAAPGALVELEFRPPRRSVLRFWNGWRLSGAHHAWLGNAGMVVETLDTPPGAQRRLRFWCSDGFGDPSFDDLVAVVTIAPIPPEPGSDGREHDARDTDDAGDDGDEDD